MQNQRLAQWIFRGLKILNLCAKIVLTIFIALAGLAITTTFSGGKIGEFKMFSEWRVLAPMLLSGVIHSSALLLITQQLQLITQSHIENDPFVPENGVRLKKIAIYLGIMELSRYFVQVLTGLIIAFAGQPDDGDLSVKIAPNLVAWGAVFIILLLSQIFKEGARLRKNDQLTI